MKKLIQLFFIFAALNFSVFANLNNPTSISNDTFLKTIGQMYTKNSTDKEILDWLNDSIRLNTKQELAEIYYFYRGYLYRTRYEDFINALNDFKTALKYNPNDDSILQELFYVYHNLGDIQGEIEITKKRIKNNPQNIDLFNFCAAAYYKLNNLDKVVKYTTESIKIKNKNPEAFKLRGVAELELGLKTKGIQDLNYARQQYLEIGDMKNYKNMISLINDTLKNQNRNNFDNQKDMQGIERAIRDLNITHIIHSEY